MTFRITESALEMAVLRPDELEFGGTAAEQTLLRLHYIATPNNYGYICNMDTKKFVDGYNISIPKSGDLKDISHNIGEWRKQRGLTQESLGAALGMDKSQVCKLEKGGNPTIESIVRVFAAMDSSVRISVEKNLSKEEHSVPLLVLCISEFAKKHKLQISQAYRYLKNLGGIDYFLDNVEAMLSLSVETIIEDMELVCRRRGGLL